MNLEDVKKRAADAGYALTPKDLEHIGSLQTAERARLAALAPVEAEAHGWAERFNRAYPRFLEALIGVGDVLLMFTRTVIIAFGVPLGLALVMVVEQQRVVHGITLFELDAALAAIASWFLVLVNLVLEINIHYVEEKAGYHAARDTRWSLRLWANNMAYRLGLGERWEAIELSPAQRQRRVLGLVTMTILALALAGSMKVVISQQPGAWYIALQKIISDSSLSEMMTWLGGLLFALAAVLTAQVLSRYVAVRCVEIALAMQSRVGGQVNYAAEMDAVAAQYITARLAEKQAKQAAKQQEKPVVVTPVEVKPEAGKLPFGTTAHMPDGLADMSTIKPGNGYGNGNGTH